MKNFFSALLIGAVAATAMPHPIEFESIRHWTGSGPNRAALVIQFNGETYGPDAYVWGYRWENGQKPDGEEMFKAICANSSRLSLLTQKTGTMGGTVCGIGYGLNQEALGNVRFDFDKARNFEFINFDYYTASSFLGQTAAPGDNAPAIARNAIDEGVAGSHVIQHPFDQPAYGYPAYDYDCWLLDDAVAATQGPGSIDTKWKSAWYEGYWSFWNASRPTDRFTYSGTGFTGATLTDNSAHAWSFTQFDHPQAAGMGEGTAPCEDGEIIYIPARLVDGGVNPGKAVRRAGEGDRSIPVVVRWGNPRAIDNIVYDYRFNDRLPEIGRLTADLAAADPAFKVVADGNTVRKISFDANGDGSIGGASSDASSEGEWLLTEYEDCLILSLGAPTKPEYLFYLPETGIPGVWIPETAGFHLSDNDNHIPVLVQPKPEHDALNYTWYRRADDSEVHGNTSTDVIQSVGTSSSNYGKLTYTGTKAGTVYLHVRARIGKGADYAYSNICRFELAAPEIPITGLSFRDTEVEAALTSKIDNPLVITPENATFTKVKYTTSDSKVVTATLTATTTPGEATITAQSVFSPEVTASFKATTRLMNPVEGIAIKGVEGNTIRLTPKEMIGIICEFTPADADIQTVDVKLEGNGNSRDELTASMYKVNYWDENNTRVQFYELNGHRAGECKLTVSAQDGTGYSREYIVKVEEPDRSRIDGGYLDGTLFLNEEWFGHTNGGMNYITPRGEMIYQAYERENPGMSFGSTSQYATIWAGKLLVASKQPADGGDPLPGGGRLVVADAATLKRVGSIDEFKTDGESRSGDGRAIAGATPSKAYVGTTQGIYIVDIDQVKVTGKIKGDSEQDTDLYSGQIGDMVTAGHYVFAIKQNTGTFVIDTSTDRIVKTIADPGVQGITVCADGFVWIATMDGTRSKFMCVNPVTLEEEPGMTAVMPDHIGTVTCGWGAWRSTAFYGSRNDNAIWFSTGASGIAGGSGGGYYRWQTGTPPEDARLVFSLGNPALQGTNSRIKQKAYGTPRYDDRSDELIVSTVEDGSSGHYRYNWIHFIDPAAGTIKRTIEMRPYYWFPCFALFPDKYDAEISLDEVTAEYTEGIKAIDLSEYVSDRDNIDANIRLTLLDEPALAAGIEAPATCADVTLEGRTLTVSPKSAGSRQFTLAAESNGRTVSKTVNVTVTDLRTGIKAPKADNGSISCDGRRTYFRNLDSTEFSLYGTNGNEITRFIVDSEYYVAEFALTDGIYILRGSNGMTAKIVLNK